MLQLELYAIIARERQREILDRIGLDALLRGLKVSAGPTRVDPSTRLQKPSASTRVEASALEGNR